MSEPPQADPPGEPFHVEPLRRSGITFHPEKLVETWSASLIWLRSWRCVQFFAMRSQTS